MTAIVCSMLFEHFAFGDHCLLYIWTHKRQAIREYMQAAWFVKMIYSVTVLWSGTFLFSLLWRCKIVTPPFVQLHTRVYDRPKKIAKFMPATRRGSKIDFFAVLTVLCRIEWSGLAVGNYRIHSSIKHTLHFLIENWYTFFSLFLSSDQG